MNIEVTVKTLISESNFLLKKDIITDEDFNEYKENITNALVKILLITSNKEIKENIDSILSQKLVQKPSFFLIRWIIQFFDFKSAMHHNAPFLIRYDTTSIYKRYIFWNTFSLKGIVFKISN